MPRRPPSLLHSRSYYSLLRVYLQQSSSSIELLKSGSSENSSSNNSSHNIRSLNLNVNPLRHTTLNHRKSHLSELQCAENRNGSKQIHHHHHHHHHHSHGHGHGHIHHHHTHAPPPQNSDAAMVEFEKVNDGIDPIQTQHNTNATIMQRSLPIFEVLPPTSEVKEPDPTSYDCVRRIANATMLKKTGSGKLILDYAKYMKKVVKPADNEVVFGSSTLLTNKNCGWERSRIDWLLDLERRQEPQRKQQKTKEQQKKFKSKKGKTKKHFNKKEDGNYCCFPFPPTSKFFLD